MNEVRNPRSRRLALLLCGMVVAVGCSSYSDPADDCVDCGACGVSGPALRDFLNLSHTGTNEATGDAVVRLTTWQASGCVGDGPFVWIAHDGATAAMDPSVDVTLVDLETVSYDPPEYVWLDRDLTLLLTREGDLAILLRFNTGVDSLALQCTSDGGEAACTSMP